MLPPSMSNLIHYAELKGIQLIMRLFPGYQEGIYGWIKNYPIDTDY